MKGWLGWVGLSCYQKSTFGHFFLRFTNQIHYCVTCTGCVFFIYICETCVSLLSRVSLLMYMKRYLLEWSRSFSRLNISVRVNVKVSVCIAHHWSAALALRCWCVTAVVCSRLINLNKSSSDAATRAATATIGSAVFYAVTTYVSHETKFYPPTRQFFSFCIEMLGQVWFIFGEGKPMNMHVVVSVNERSRTVFCMYSVRTFAWI